MTKNSKKSAVKVKYSSSELYKADEFLQIKYLSFTTFSILFDLEPCSLYLEHCLLVLSMLNTNASNATHKPKCHRILEVYINQNNVTPIELDCQILKNKHNYTHKDCTTYNIVFNMVRY